MEIKEKILMILTDRLSACHVDIVDDSLRHAAHDGAKQSGGGHYRLMIVSDRFAHKTPLERHRMVYDILKTEFQTSIHALTIHAYTPQEWNSRV